MLVSQLWSSRRLLHSSASLCVCVLQTKIGLSKGQRNAGWLKDSHFCLLVSLPLYHTCSSKKKEKKPSPHIRTCSSIDKMTYYPSLHTSLSLPRFIKLLTSPQNGWHSSSLSLVLCSDLEREMKQWWGSHDCCSTTPDSPLQEKKSITKMALTFPAGGRRG